MNAAMFIDTHAHFDHLPDDAARWAVLDRAREAGVVQVMAVGANPRANACVLSLVRARKAWVMAAVGYDRDMAGCEVSVAALRESLQSPDVVAVGEIGLDYHYSPATAGAQRALFEQMLALAAEVRKPVIVHSRDAEADTLAMLTDWRSGDASRVGVLHCFTGSARFAERLIELGFYIGVSGIVTFRNARSLREIIASLPLERILLETDSPYLAPVPLRGKPNEPAYISHIAQCVAQIRHDTVEHIAHSTTQNAMRLFNFHGGEKP